MTAILIPILAMVAWSDWQYRRIPNYINVAIAALSIALCFFTDVKLGQLLLNIAVALCICLPGYMKGVLGGGDVKLLLALAPAWSTMQMLFAFSTGVISLVLIQKLKVQTIGRSNKRGGEADLGVPIGTAIFLGAVYYETLQFLQL